MRLEALFQPRSVAVVGASEKPTVGRRIVASLDRIGFAGAIYPVNPAYPTVLGHPAIPASPNCRGARCRASSASAIARILDAFVAAARARHQGRGDL